MFKPFDVVAKELIRRDPRGWLRFLGVETTSPADLFETDLTAVTSEADQVIRVDDPDRPFFVHLEMQSSRDATLPERLLRYNVLVGYKYSLPVQTVLILFRREADAPELTGTHRRVSPTGAVNLEFRYEVVRVWEHPVEEFLNGSPALLPLAPLAIVDADRLRELGLRINERLGREVSAEIANMLWTSTYILAGMYYSPEQIDYMKGWRNMRESSTYQAILKEGRDEGRDEGRLEGGTNIIIRQGTKRFGAPDPLVLAALKKIVDEERLARIGERLFEAEDWEELLKTP